MSVHNIRGVTSFFHPKLHMLLGGICPPPPASYALRIDKSKNKIDGLLLFLIKAMNEAMRTFHNDVYLSMEKELQPWYWQIFESLPQKYLVSETGFVLKFN